MTNTRTRLNDFIFASGQKSEFQNSFYDRLAKEYKEDTERYTLEEDKIRTMIKLLSPLQPKVVVDLGGAYGRDYPIWKSFGVDYYLIDSSEELLKLADPAIPKFNADLTSLCFNPESVDIFWLSSVVQHLSGEELRGVFLRLFLALRPGGGMYLNYRTRTYLRNDYTPTYEHTSKYGGKNRSRYIFYFGSGYLKEMLNSVGFKVSYEVPPVSKKFSQEPERTVQKGQLYLMKPL